MHPAFLRFPLTSRALAYHYPLNESCDSCAPPSTTNVPSLSGGFARVWMRGPEQNVLGVYL